MYSCKFCKKEFKKESTLAAHLCEPKRRYQQQNETGVQLGFKAYLRFYELTQGSAKLKTYEDFVASPYYMAFVKFGRYLVAIRCINTGSFIDWLLKNNKKIDYWTKDAFYLEWMREYLKKENVKDALERALKEMQDLADDDSKLNGEFNNYFRLANANRICQHIANGRISPWIVFNCTSGVEFLETLNEEQLSMIIEWIDPDYWQRKFTDYMADTEWTKHILKQAGL
jgi:hypothetical protein